MNRQRIVLVLVALNALLAGALVWKMTTSEAQAQAVGRRPSDYLMIPATVQGGSNGVVYVLDMSNGLLGAAVYDDSNKRLNRMAPIDLNRIFENAGGIVPGAGRKGR